MQICVGTYDWHVFLLLLFKLCMQWMTLSSTEVEMSLAGREEECFVVL